MSFRTYLLVFLALNSPTSLVHLRQRVHLFPVILLSVPGRLNCLILAIHHVIGIQTVVTDNLAVF